MDPTTVAKLSRIYNKVNPLAWLVKLPKLWRRSRGLPLELKAVLIMGIVAMGWGSTAWAQVQTLDSIFGSQAVSWPGRIPATNAVAPAYWVSSDDSIGMPEGRKFEVDFNNQAFQPPNANGQDRGTWWVDTNLDLSAQKSIRLYMYVTEAAANGLTLYFFGQNGSFSNHTFRLRPGLNEVEINFDQFESKGFTGTDGWHSIKRIQVSLWRKDGGTGRGVVTVSAFQSATPVVQTLDYIFGSQAVRWPGRIPATNAVTPAYWVSSDDSIGMPEGRKFEVDFNNQAFQPPNANGQDRGTWLVDTNLDLSAQKSIRLYVYVTEAAADGLTLYFFGHEDKSYSNHTFRLKPGLNVVERNFDQFDWKGFTKTDGWHSIKRIQVSLWRKDGGTGRGVVTISAFQSASPVQTLDSIFGSQAVTWSGRIPNAIAVAPAYWVSSNNSIGMPAGRKFEVDFANQAIQYPNSHGERGSWFIDTSLNLSGQKSVKLFVYVEKGVEYLSSMTLYLFSSHSGRNQTFLLEPGVNILEVNLDKFGGAWKPDKPTDGWHNINRMMVSLWKRDNGRSWFTVSAIQSPNAVAIEKRGNGIAFTPPPGDYSVRTQVRNANNELLESRMIFDENYYLMDPANPSRPDYRDRAGVTNVLNRTQSAGFNVYMPGAWLGGGRYYRKISSGLFPFHVPLAKQDNKKSETEDALALRIAEQDPLAQLIEEAHKRRMEVHPSFAIANRDEGILPQFSESGSPVEASGEPSSFDLVDPKFRDFIVELIVDFVRNYDVDGINLDYIRTTGLSFSESAAIAYQERYSRSIEELRTLDNNEELGRFRQFQAEAVNDIVARVRKGIDALGKPRKIILSVAGHPKPRPTTADGRDLFLDNEGRNEWYWVQNGWVDVVYDMDYVRNPSVGRLANVQRSLTNGGDSASFAKLLGNTDTIDGQISARSGKELADQIEYFLTVHPGRGIGVYNYHRLTYGNNDQASVLIQRPFKEKALPFWRVLKHGGYWVR